MFLFLQEFKRLPVPHIITWLWTVLQGPHHSKLKNLPKTTQAYKKLPKPPKKSKVVDKTYMKMKFDAALLFYCDQLPFLMGFLGYRFLGWVSYWLRETAWLEWGACRLDQLSLLVINLFFMCMTKFVNFSFSFLGLAPRFVHLESRF